MTCSTPASRSPTSRSVDPDDPALICYTSGTTSAAKGVVHTHRTFLAELHQGAALRARDPLPEGAVSPLGGITGAPVGHVGGMLALFGPMLGGANLQLIDRWDPGLVLADHAGRPPHVRQWRDVLPHVTARPSRLRSHGARPAHGAGRHGRRARSPRRSRGAPRRSASRSPAATAPPSTRRSRRRRTATAPQIRLFTDGAPLPGVELRLVDDDGRDVATGTPGEILSRGPERFVGYVDATLTAASIDRDGWFATGDIGVLDEWGNLSITDRKKDIIIRGGENISAAEIEDLVLAFPGVLEVAVVAAPDRRYGEHACAFVQLDGSVAPFDLAELGRRLERDGLARQKWPEELRFLDDFPRTASGKIQKHVLRDRLRAGTHLAERR